MKGLEDYQSFFPMVEAIGQEEKPEAIGIANTRFLHLALEDAGLLAEQLILRDHLRFAEREIGGGAEEEGRASGLSQPPEGQKMEQMGDVLLAFYDLPGEHWIHLRTTNPIDSTFATVRLRQRVTKGPGSRAAAIAIAFKLIESAQHRWRAVNSAHLVALVRAGEVRERCPRRTT